MTFFILLCWQSLYFCLLIAANRCLKLPMTGFEPKSSGVGSYRSIHCATTTAPYFLFESFPLFYQISIILVSTVCRPLT